MKKDKLTPDIIFIALQFTVAFIIVLITSFKHLSGGGFLSSLAFYLAVFIIPLFLFIVIGYKTNPVTYFDYNFKKSYIGIVVAAIMLLIFFITHSFRLNINYSGSSLTLAIFGTVLAAAFEETVFRGFYLKILSNKISFIAANIAVSVLFASLHISQIASAGLIQPFFMFVFSILIGYLYKESDSLVSTIIVHASYNIMIILF